MNAWIICGYLVVVFFSTLFNISLYQTTNARYQAFFALGAMPSFSGFGRVGNINCTGPFVCGHYQCKTRESYVSLNYSDNCDITFDGMKSRLNVTYVSENLDILLYACITYLSVGFFIGVSLGIIVISSSDVPSGMNKISSTIIILLDISTSMYQIYIITLVSGIRPNIPNYYSISDDKLWIVQISIVCLRLVLSLVCTVSVFIATTKVSSQDIEDALEFFRVEYRDINNQKISDDLTQDENTDITEDAPLINH